MKYIVFENQKTKIKHVVLFSDHTSHSTIKIDESYEDQPSPEIKPISAGFWFIDKGVVKTHLESTSLKLKPMKKDSDLITAVLQNMGIYAFM